MTGLKSLLKERETNFRDHIENRRKKFIVAIKRIVHPFTLLTLLYVALLIVNTSFLRNNNEAEIRDKWPELSNMDKGTLITQHLITIIDVLLLVIIDIYLRI